MIRAVLFAAALIFATPMTFAGAGTETAQEVVEGVATDISACEHEQLAEAVLQNLDVPAIATFTLGRHAKHLDASTKGRFVEAFEAYLRDQIDANAHQFVGANLNVVDTNQRNSKDAIVTTMVDHAGQRVTVRWRVIKRGDVWSVVDVQFAGVWLAIEQRAQIAALLDRPGTDIDDVIERFH